MTAVNQQVLVFTNRVRTSAERHAREVYAILADGQWHTAKSCGLNERVVRAVAEDSKGKILGGQKGYCLTKHASVAEVAHVEAFLLSQAAKMKHRAYEIRQARNAK